MKRKCQDCTFCHPERPSRPCSVFRELQNKQGDCSAYIANASPGSETVEERIRRELQRVKGSDVSSSSEPQHF